VLRNSLENASASASESAAASVSASLFVCLGISVAGRVYAFLLFAFPIVLRTAPATHKPSPIIYFPTFIHTFHLLLKIDAFFVASRRSHQAMPYRYTEKNSLILKLFHKFPPKKYICFRKIHFIIFNIICY